MRLLKIYLFALLISSNQILVAQEDVTEGEAPSTVQQLLELVKEGQVREQSENARFLISLSCIVAGALKEKSWLLAVFTQ